MEWVTGAGALAAMAVICARLGDSLDGVAQLGGLLFAAHMMFAWIVYNWRRPTTVRVIRAKDIIDSCVTDAVERRIDSLIVNGRFLLALLVLAAMVVAATPMVMTTSKSGGSLEPTPTIGVTKTQTLAAAKPTTTATSRTATP
jgi:D-arabinose 1-dehydrogenase-like Zn-dependent alcohol dehydrogenase